MTLKTRSVERIEIGIAVVTLAVLMLWPSSRKASADEGLDDFLAYGVANISLGQTARLHVVSVGNPDIQPAELVIYDRQGNVLSRSLERLSPGRAVFLDLRFADHTGIAVGSRLEFYAAVRFAKPSGQDKGYLIPSLEIMEDATGHTIRTVIDPLA
jgi:hypothetical protein